MQRRKQERKSFAWALELVLGVAYDVLRRFVKDWVKSLTKSDPLRQTTSSERQSSRDGRELTNYPVVAQERSKQTGRAQKFPPNIALNVLQNAATEWVKDKCPQLGAALAYYTVFSLAPLIVVLLGVFGLIYGGNEQARQKILEQLSYLMDRSAVKVVQDIAENASQPTASLLATVVGILVALFGASGIFGQLQDALNTIWSIRPKPSRGIWSFVRARFLSFGMVGGVCFLLLTSLTLEGVLHTLHDYLQALFPGGHYLGLAIFYCFDLAMIAMLFAMLFRCLPDAKIAWRDVWTGAVLTALLFVLGKFLLGLYLGSGAAGSAYGAASSLITLLLWVFYSAQILLFGAEFTKVYANTCGSLVEPYNYAVKIEKREIELPPKSQVGSASTGSF
ncbi:MAG: YihY/virulence factor BrkB family protein [Verrucomicrobia bacterium]|nr:YihY/virulence factor BrkB family protein [Verrucomicrobiota bacterium]